MDKGIRCVAHWCTGGFCIKFCTASIRANSLLITRFMLYVLLLRVMDSIYLDAIEARNFYQ